MPSLKYVGLFLIIIIFGMLFIPKIIDRVNSDLIVDSSRSQSAEPLNFIVLNGEAKKVLPFMFTNQDSLLISNEDFLGKVYVAEFFFTSCPSICPIMNKNMKIIEEIYGARGDFGIASFTIDPDHDTPSVLKKYAGDYDVFSQNWHFLTGQKDAIYSLANSGFNIFASINPKVEGGFEHYGNPIVYYMGLDQEGVEEQDVDLLIKDIKKLLDE
jgi:protein SCO1/2